MSLELVKVFSTDGYIMHGHFYRPTAGPFKVALLHVHGLAGNFYENEFVEAIGVRCTLEGIGYLAINNRGHDFIADISNVKGNTARLGAAYEVFSDCIHDISGGIEWLLKEGATHVIIEGHSTGANKVAFAAQRLRNQSIRGLIFISPCDDIALQRSVEESSQFMKEAVQRVAAGNARSLMPDESFFGYPLSAGAYVDLFTENSAHDVFPFRNPDADWPVVRELTYPILISYGGQNDFISVSCDRAIELIRSKAELSSRVDGVILDGGHSYKGNANRLAESVVNWISLIEK